MTRRICVVTGTRADYGLLYCLLQGLRADPQVELQVVACGMHLSPEFGDTWRAIEADGLPIAAKVEMLLSGDTPSAVAKSVGLGVIGFADAYARLDPDVVVVLGDRTEIFAAAQAAMIGGRLLAHIHGGELTEGILDDPVRHAITKMAQLHFTAAEGFARRVVQMGETPESVFAVGAPGLEAARCLPLLDRAALEADLGFALGETLLLVTYHPVTWGVVQPEAAFAELLAALDAFPDARVIVTWPNSDAGGRALIPMIEHYAAARPRVLAVRSLGQLRYLSAMRQAAALVGNTSSGIIEAPSFATPTVNLGIRQDRRPRAASVIDCAEERGAITAAICRALSAEFRAGLAGMVNPYDGGDTAARIITVLKGPLEAFRRKRFHDL